MTVRLPLLWFSVLILFVALVIQLARWKRAVETENRLARVETAGAASEHHTWLGQVADAEDKQRRLEAQLLWSGRETLLPQLGRLSQGLSLSLVGVEELPESRRGGYLFRPLHLSFSGDYAGFATFLSVVERITPTIRIEEVRLYRRKRQIDTLWMSLTLSPMHKTVESEKQKLTTNHSPPVTIKMPAIRRFSVDRSPFTLTTHALAPAKRLTDAPLPQLTGILWDDANPIAILGGGGVGATILSIQPGQVIVKRGGQRHELELWKKQ